MNRNDFTEAVFDLEVYDTHTHLNADALSATSFFDLAHYSWFLRELQAAGYPPHPDELPESRREEAFMKAFTATYNTSMNWVVRRILRDLYNVNLGSVKDLRQADEAIRHKDSRADRAGITAGYARIRHAVVNDPQARAVTGFPDRVVPRIGKEIESWMSALEQASDPVEESERISAEIDVLCGQCARQEFRGIMVTDGVFGALTGTEGGQVVRPAAGAGSDEIGRFLLHEICRAAEKHGLFIQLFLGVRKICGNNVPVYDPGRVVRLHGLFAGYRCRFELLAACDQNNTDAVQAARVYPNVYAGGLWWQNFRVSSFRQAMQYRLESLPPSKCPLVASDARCIEWCYGKVQLVKKMLADFLYEQIRSGWLDEPEALRVAEEWLSQAASGLAGENRL